MKVNKIITIKTNQSSYQSQNMNAFRENTLQGTQFSLGRNPSFEKVPVQRVYNPSSKRQQPKRNSQIQHGYQSHGPISAQKGNQPKRNNPNQNGDLSLRDQVGVLKKRNGELEGEIEITNSILNERRDELIDFQLQVDNLNTQSHYLQQQVWTLEAQKLKLEKQEEDLGIFKNLSSSIGCVFGCYGKRK